MLGRRPQPLPIVTLKALLCSEGCDVRRQIANLISGQGDSRHCRMWNDDPSGNSLCSHLGTPCNGSKAWHVRLCSVGRRAPDGVTGHAQPVCQLLAARCVADSLRMSARSNYEQDRERNKSEWAHVRLGSVSSGRSVPRRVCEAIDRNQAPQDWQHYRLRFLVCRSPLEAKEFRLLGAPSATGPRIR